MLGAGGDHRARRIGWNTLIAEPGGNRAPMPLKPGMGHVAQQLTEPGRAGDFPHRRGEGGGLFVVHRRIIQPEIDPAGPRWAGTDIGETREWTFPHKGATAGLAIDQALGDRLGIGPCHGADRQPQLIGEFPVCRDPGAGG